MSTQPDSAEQPWHTHRFAYFAGALDSHLKTGEDYKTQTLSALWSMEPTNKPKSSGFAMIPSSYSDYDARSHKQQRANGSFIALVSDIDGGNHDAATICAAVQDFAPGASYFVYSSPHNRPGSQRWRIILPLTCAVPFDTWFDAQTALFTFLEARGIDGDHALTLSGSSVCLCAMQARYFASVPPALRVRASSQTAAAAIQ